MQEFFVLACINWNNRGTWSIIFDYLSIMLAVSSVSSKLYSQGSHDWLARCCAWVSFSSSGTEILGRRNIFISLLITLNTNDINTHLRSVLHLQWLLSFFFFRFQRHIWHLSLHKARNVYLLRLWLFQAWVCLFDKTHMYMRGFTMGCDRMTWYVLEFYVDMYVICIKTYLRLYRWKSTRMLHENVYICDWYHVYYRNNWSANIIRLQLNTWLYICSSNSILVTTHQLFFLRIAHI